MDSYLRIGRDLAVKDLGTTTKSLFTVDSAPLLDRINNVDPRAALYDHTAGHRKH